MAWAGTAGNHNILGGDIRNKQESQRRRDTKLQGSKRLLSLWISGETKLQEVSLHIVSMTIK